MTVPPVVGHHPSRRNDESPERKRQTRANTNPRWRSGISVPRQNLAMGHLADQESVDPVDEILVVVGDRGDPELVADAGLFF